MERDRWQGWRGLVAFSRRWDLLAAFLLGCTVTAAVHHFRPAAFDPPAPEPTAEREAGLVIREGPVGLLNPLLECDSFRASPLLRPFTDKLDSLVARLKSERRVGTASIYFRDLNNGPWFGVDERRFFRPGSLLKVPLLIACLRQAEIDPGFLARRVTFTGVVEDARALGTQLVRPAEPLVRGRSYRVEELLARMTRYSDNLATELLNRTVDPAIAAQTYGSFGIDMAELARRGTTLTAIDYSRFFRVLYNSSYLSRAHSQQALAMLVESEFHEGLVAGVPPGTIVSHKFGEKGRIDATGAADLQLHDCGIIYHPTRPYCLCVMTTGMDYQLMASAIAEISREVFVEIDGQASRDLGLANPPLP